MRGTDVAALAGIMLAVAARTGWGGLAGLVVPLFLFISAAGKAKIHPVSRIFSLT